MRSRLVLVCAGALALLYAYSIVNDFRAEVEVNPLNLVGLALALGLLIIEVASSKKG